MGDPVAGKAVFAANGCASCHTLAAAGATGNVGPNLDQAKFEELAKGAEKNCPISKVLNAEITLDAKLV